MKKISIAILAALLFACSSPNDSILNSPTIQFDGNRQILFLHHSVGAQVMPYLRPMINEYNASHTGDFQFYDDNGYQLAANSGHYFGGYGMPGGASGSDFPSGYSTVFNMPIDNDGVMENAFERFMLPHTLVNARYNWRDTIDYDAVVVKTCFVANRLFLESWVPRDSLYYLQIRAIADMHPEKQFIIFTSPPLTRYHGGSNPLQAALLGNRCRRMANFLTSDQFTSGHNVIVYNLYDLLADNTLGGNYQNYLKVEFGGAGQDSHPNIAGRQAAAQGIMNYLISVFEE